MVWNPPADDPRKISIASYYGALEPYVAIYEKQFQPDTGRPDQYAYEAVTIFSAAWKATREAAYADLAVTATRAFCKWLDTDTQAQVKAAAGGRPNIGSYWLPMCANFVLAMDTMAGTPQKDQIKALLAPSLGHRADAFPIYWEKGAMNRTIMAAHWYDLALSLTPDLHQATALRIFADGIWNAWWPACDLDEDDSHYSTVLDLLLLDSWCRLRQTDWWRNTAMGANLWRHYCEEITNDGTLPAYGDGGVHGYYFPALRFAELAASRTRERRYKWLAHRAFWNGRDRMAELQSKIGYTCAIELALAYQVADDTVTETPPAAGLTVTQRRSRERTDWSAPNFSGPFFTLHDWTASKVIFRSGPSETDHCLIVQAASAAGHGHPDAGNIAHYSGDWSQYLCHGVTRLDHYLEHHNLPVLQDPAVSIPESQGYMLPFVSEATSVPVYGSAPDAGYARVHIGEYPGITPTEAWWQQIRGLRSGYPPPHAIGYKNWPVRVDRSVLFVNNAFTLVRDLISFSLDASAVVGQNWITGDNMDTPGPNWVNTRIPVLYGHPYETPPLAPVEQGNGELLIWIVPDGAATMQVVHGPRNSWFGNYYINLPNRVWSPRAGDWKQGQQLPYATLLMPHPPSVPAADLATAIDVIRHDQTATILHIRSGSASRILAVSNQRAAIDVPPFMLNAEAAVVTFSNGVPSRLSAWRISKLTMGGATLLDLPDPADISITDFRPGTPLA
jgi:hypothetical protein